MMMGTISVYVVLMFILLGTAIPSYSAPLSSQYPACVYQNITKHVGPFEGFCGESCECQRSGEVTCQGSCTLGSCTYSQANEIYPVGSTFPNICVTGPKCTCQRGDRIGDFNADSCFGCINNLVKCSWRQANGSISTYLPGAMWKDMCNTCKCSPRGIISCSQYDCPVTPPSFKTCRSWQGHECYPGEPCLGDACTRCMCQEDGTLGDCNTFSPCTLPPYKCVNEEGRAFRLGGSYLRKRDCHRCTCRSNDVFSCTWSSEECTPTVVPDDCLGESDKCRIESFSKQCSDRGLRCQSTGWKNGQCTFQCVPPDTCRVCRFATPASCNPVSLPPFGEGEFQTNAQAPCQWGCFARGSQCDGCMDVCRRYPTCPRPIVANGLVVPEGELYQPDDDGVSFPELCLTCYQQEYNCSKIRCEPMMDCVLPITAAPTTTLSPTSLATTRPPSTSSPTKCQSQCPVMFCAGKQVCKFNQTSCQSACICTGENPCHLMDCRGQCQLDQITCEGRCLPPPTPRPPCENQCSVTLCAHDHRCDMDTDTCSPRCVPTVCRDEFDNEYKNGQSFYSRCNRCACESGVSLCTEIGCDPQRCYDAQGKSYRQGQSFYNRCNRCTCGPDGRSVCTKMICDPTKCYNSQGRVVPCLSVLTASFNIKPTRPNSYATMKSILHDVVTRVDIPMDQFIFISLSCASPFSNLCQRWSAKVGFKPASTQSWDQQRSVVVALRNKYMQELQRMTTVTGVVVNGVGDDTFTVESIDGEAEITETIAVEMCNGVLQSSEMECEQMVVSSTSASSSSSANLVVIIVPVVVGVVILLLVIFTAVTIHHRRADAVKNLNGIEMNTKLEGATTV